MLPARNQFTGHVALDAFVHDVLAHRSERVLSEPLGVIACRRGRGPGFSSNSGGYTRVNFNGGKISIHMAVLEVTAGAAPEAGTPGALSPSILCGRTVLQTSLAADVLAESWLTAFTGSESVPTSQSARLLPLVLCAMRTIPLPLEAVTVD
jgi:hypothetical protein